MSASVCREGEGKGGERKTKRREKREEEGEGEGEGEGKGDEEKERGRKRVRVREIRETREERPDIKTERAIETHRLLSLHNQKIKSKTKNIKQLSNCC